MRFAEGLSAGVLFAGVAFSGPAGAETIDEALAFAYTSNPVLLAERAHLRASDELVPQALSNWRPAVSLTGAAGYANGHTNDSSDSRSANQTMVSRPASMGVNVSQPLYRGGRTTAQTDQAEATVLAERARLASTEQTVLLNVASAYMTVVAARAVVDLNINNEQVLDRQLEATRSRFRVGEVTRTDVAQSEARLSAAHASRRQADGDLQVAAAGYVTAVGHPPADVAEPSPLAVLPQSLDEARAQALAGNPSLQSAERNYEAAQHGIDLVAGELLPEVSLNATASREKDYYGPYTYERVRQATVNVTVPIYQQGQEYARLRQQKHLAGEARTNVDVARRDTIEAATRAWEQVQTARARIGSFKDQVAAQIVALEGVQREAEVGSRTVLDILDAEQELLSARVNLVTAQRDEVVAEYALKGAVGQLTAQSLALPVELYDPLKHYEAVRDRWIGTGTETAGGEGAK